MLKIWFMYENHTFDRIEVRDKDGMIEAAQDRFATDGCGCLFVRDDLGGRLESLTLHGHQLHQVGKYHWKYGVNYDEVAEWADKVLVELEFQKLMVA